MGCYLTRNLSVSNPALSLLICRSSSWPETYTACVAIVPGMLTDSLCRVSTGGKDDRGSFIPGRAPATSLHPGRPRRAAPTNSRERQEKCRKRPPKDEIPPKHCSKISRERRDIPGEWCVPWRECREIPSCPEVLRNFAGDRGMNRIKVCAVCRDKAPCRGI